METNGLWNGWFCLGLEPLLTAVRNGIGSAFGVRCSSRWGSKKFLSRLFVTGSLPLGLGGGLRERTGNFRGRYGRNFLGYSIRDATGGPK